jgi:hypothetical protein
LERCGFERRELIGYLKAQRRRLHREGSRRSILANPSTGAGKRRRPVTPEIDGRLARKICREPGIPLIRWPRQARNVPRMSAALKPGLRMTPADAGLRAAPIGLAGIRHHHSRLCSTTTPPIVLEFRGSG